MQLLEAISGPEGRNLTRLAKGLELDPEETASVLRAVMPEISQSIERETLSRGGLAQIIHF